MCSRKINPLFLFELFAFVALAFLFFGCASTDDKNLGAEKHDGGKTEKSLTESESASLSEDYQADESLAVSIPLPMRKRNSFFANVDREVLAFFEDGSPESISKGIARIKKSDASYSDEERILLYIASNVMKICWPSSKVAVPSVPVDDLSGNKYVGAVDFARDGIYDFSTGSSDFFSQVLPSLTLLSESSSDDYFDKSEPLLADALSKNKNSVVANYLFAVLKEKMGLYEDAYGCLEKIRKYSSCFEILYRLSECYLKAGESEKSRAVAESISAPNPFLALKVVKLCAESSFALGDLDSAEKYAVRVLQSEPENLKFILLRAHVFVLKGDYIRASPLLDSYAKSDTSSRDYLILRSKVQKEWNKNTIAAAFTLEKAVGLYPDDVEVLLAAAKLASETDSQVAGMSAGEYASKILAVQGDNLEAVGLLVQNFISQQNFDSAYELSSKVVARIDLDELTYKNEESDAKKESDVASVDVLSVLFRHIEICLASKKNEEAWKLASKIYSKHGDVEEAVQSYISVLVATSRRNEARTLISKLLPESSAKMRSFLYYQKSFLDVGDDNVLADLRSSLTSNPRNKDTLYRLYLLYFKKKEYRKAQYYLKQLMSISPNDSNIKKLNNSLDSLINSER